MFKNIISTMNYIVVGTVNIVKYKLGLISYTDIIKEACNELSKINIIYAKILQWDIFKSILPTNNEIQDYFTWFNSNVPYTENDINYDILNNIILYIKNTNQTLVFENNFKPINSGTVALVFKAKLNGKPVAIKILRKNIHKHIEEGINTVSSIIKVSSFLISFIYTINSLAIMNIINVNTKTLLEQTNLSIEILNNEKFQTISKQYNIIIPSVYKEFNLISNEIIVMDFLEGISPSANTDNFSKYSEMFTRFMIETYTHYKFVHADLHTGNVICLENEKGIGVIDFGLVITLTDKEAEYISDFLFSIKNKNYNRLVKSLSKLVFDDDKILRDKFIDLCNTSDKLQTLRDNFTTFDSKLILDALQLINSVKINENNRSVKILLSLVSCFSIINLTNYQNLSLVDHLENTIFKFN